MDCACAVLRGEGGGSYCIPQYLDFFCILLFHHSVAETMDSHYIMIGSLVLSLHGPQSHGIASSIAVKQPFIGLDVGWSTSGVRISARAIGVIEGNSVRYLVPYLRKLANFRNFLDPWSTQSRSQWGSFKLCTTLALRCQGIPFHGNEVMKFTVFCL